jgi:hypothetical protein
LRDTHCCDGAAQRCIRDVQSSGSSRDGEHIRIGGLVIGEHRGDHLGLVAVVLGELGTDRAIDHPAHQGLTLVGATLSLEVVARDGAVGAVAILIIAGEGHEVEAGGAACDCGDEDR